MGSMKIPLTKVLVDRNQCDSPVVSNDDTIQLGCVSRRVSKRLLISTAFVEELELVTQIMRAANLFVYVGGDSREIDYCAFELFFLKD